MKIDMTAVMAHVEASRVCKRRDPFHGTYSILNYTEKCVYENSWDEITMQCRATIVTDDGEVIAKGFKKFGNMGQWIKIDEMPPDIPELADKLDGSLVCVWWDPQQTKWRATTRGGWDGMQAKAAQLWLPKLPLEHMHIGKTYLFELCAPWNRIVVMYPEERLVMIGLVDNASWYEASYAEVTAEANRIGWEDVVQFWMRDPKSVDLAAKCNEEGFCVRWSNGLRAKMKYTEYVRLHKILTGFSLHGIWEGLAQGTSPDLSNLPEEFMAWYRGQIAEFQKQYSLINADVLTAWMNRPVTDVRKDLALSWAKLPPPVKASLFAKLDGKDHSGIIWKALKPHGQQPTFTCDTEK